MAAVVIIAVVTAVTIASVASAWREADRRIATKVHELQAIVRTLAAAVAPGLSNASKTDVAQTLSAIGRIPGIEFARVTDQSGKLIHQFGMGVVVGRNEGAHKPNAALGPLSPVYLQTYPVTADIVSSGIVIGQLEIIADLSQLRDALLESLSTSLMAGALASLLGVALSHFLQRSISGPVSQLSKAMEDIARTRDYSVAVSKTSEDEVGNLVTAFNTMLREIRGRDEALAAIRDSLEVKVAERTIELEAAKASADHANAAKSDFLATMSHEIRTPMNGMLVMAELIAAGDLPPRLQSYAGTLVKSGQSLLAIINDILDFSKIEAGKLEIEAVPCSPAAIVDDVVRLFHERASAKNLELAAYVAGNLPATIAADPVRLSQIVTNLVNNALKFTTQGHVVVRVTAAPDALPGRADLRIAVTDSGIGIAPEKLAAIFDPFTQEDQTTNRRFGGTGIGLTICNRLAGAMGGAIEVTSVQTKGSTFALCVSVPVLAGAQPSKIAAGHHDRDVVIALGDGAIRSVLAETMADAAFTTRFETLEHVTRGSAPPPGAIIARASDFTRAMKARDSWLSRSNRPVLIALSRFGDNAANEMYERGAVDLVLGLPLTSAEMAAAIAAIRSGKAELAAAKAAARAAAAKPLLALPFKGARVLAADDSAVNREVLTEALGRLGISVHCVDDGQAALEAAKTGAYDLIFMDGSMPVMDGFEATRAIRSHEAGANRPAIPIVALTAHVVGAGAGLWREAGMSDCVTKPFTLASLETCLRRWLKPDETALMEADPVGRSGAATDSPSTEAGVDVPSAQIPLVDYGVLDSIKSMQAPGDDLVGRIVAMYAQHAPVALERLRGALPNGIAKEIADAAHALKSLSRNAGALQAGDACDAIERQARRGDCTDLEPAVDSLSGILERTHAQLLEAAAMKNAA